MDKAALRQAVREFLRMAARGKICTLEMLVVGAGRLVPFDVHDSEVRDAIEWNQSKGYVDFEYKAEAEVDSYYLTERGRELE